MYEKFDLDMAHVEKRKFEHFQVRQLNTQTWNNDVY